VKQAFVLDVRNIYPLGEKGTVLQGWVVAGRVAVGEQVTVVLPTQEKQCVVSAIEVERRLVEFVSSGVESGLLLANLSSSEVGQGVLSVRGVTP
jgi:translation elongation factor EF-Tu-like GTPase